MAAKPDGVIHRYLFNRKKRTNSPVSYCLLIADGPWPLSVRYRTFSALSCSTRIVSDDGRCLLLLQFLFLRPPPNLPNSSVPFSIFSCSPAPSRPSARCSASWVALTPPLARGGFGGGGGGGGGWRLQVLQSLVLVVSIPTPRHWQPSGTRISW
jgi:hypothetical protein